MSRQRREFISGTERRRQERQRNNNYGLNYTNLDAFINGDSDESSFDSGPPSPIGPIGPILRTMINGSVRNSDDSVAAEEGKLSHNVLVGKHLVTGKVNKVAVLQVYVQ